MSQIQIRNNNLLVIPDNPVEMSGSIILTDYSKVRPTTGIVFMVGPKVRDVKIKDKIIYEDTARNELEVSGRKMYLMNEDNVLAIID